MNIDLTTEHVTGWHITNMHEAIVSRPAGAGLLVMPSADEADAADLLGLDEDGLTPREVDLLRMVARLDRAGFSPLVAQDAQRAEDWQVIGTTAQGRPVVVLAPIRPVLVPSVSRAEALDDMLAAVGVL